MKLTRNTTFFILLSVLGCGVKTPLDGADVGSDADTQIQSDVVILLDSEASPEKPDRGGDTGMESDTGADRDTATASESDTMTDSGADTATALETDAATDIETDTSTDIETDTGTATATVTAEDTEGDTGTTGPMVIPQEAIVVQVDPYARAPLTAIVAVTHPRLRRENVSELAITVAGQGGADDLSATLDVTSELFHTHFDMTDRLEADQVGIPILGLFPGATTHVAFTITAVDDVFRGEVDIAIDPIEELADETVTVDIADPTRMEPGWTYLNHRVYDRQGNCRWIGRNIIHILDNGNLLSNVDEYNWLGKRVINRTLPTTMKLHHDAIDLPNGHIVATITNREQTVVDSDGTVLESIQDYAVELGESDSTIENAWDLRPYLDVDRGTVADTGEDWFHNNTLGYDAYDDSVLFSGRHQGLVKITRGGLQGDVPNLNKRLVWILAPHLGWGLAGADGLGPEDTNDYLLTAVDSDGVPYPEAVQKNLAAPDRDRDEFYWPVGQHGIEITHREPGRLRVLLFNNQASFIFDGEDTVNNGASLYAEGDKSNDRSLEPYSKMIEYEIDEIAMTVRQVWQFGPEDYELYGGFASGVATLRSTGNRLFTTNGASQINPRENPQTPTSSRSRRRERWCIGSRSTGPPFPRWTTVACSFTTPNSQARFRARCKSPRAGGLAGSFGPSRGARLWTASKVVSRRLMRRLRLRRG